MKNRKNKLMIVLLMVFFLGCTSLKKGRESQYSLLKGMNLSQQGDFEKALIYYNDSYSKNPKEIILLKEMGYIYFVFGQYKKAEHYWLEGLNLSKHDDELIKNLITMYYKIGEYEKAIEISKNSFNPNDEYYARVKALIFYNQGDISNAYNILKNLNKSNFDELTYIKYLSILKERESQEKFYEALMTGKLLYKNRKDYTLVCSKELTNEFKKYKEAENILLNYLVKNGNDKEIILMLSWVYSQSGNKQKAEDSLLLLAK